MCDAVCQRCLEGATGKYIGAIVRGVLLGIRVSHIQQKQDLEGLLANGSDSWRSCRLGKGKVLAIVGIPM